MTFKFITIILYDIMYLLKEGISAKFIYAYFARIFVSIIHEVLTSFNWSHILEVSKSIIYLHDLKIMV